VAVRTLIEAAAAIRKATVGVAEIDPGMGVAVEGAHGADGARDLLSIGAHVLHRRAADGAGNAAETFDSGESGIDAAGDERIPAFACSGRECGSIAFDPAQRNVE